MTVIYRNIENVDRKSEYISLESLRNPFIIKTIAYGLLL